MQCNSLVSFGLERVLMTQQTWPERSGVHAFFVYSVSNRGVLFLFKEKGTYYHYKGGLATDYPGLGVSAKKGEVNRW